MLRVGLLGAGRIGRIHGGNIAAHPRAILAAVADVDATAAAAIANPANAKIANVETALADKDIDAVVIGTPTDTHADLIERAVKAGKAVFCEKPIDLDLDRVRACLDAIGKVNGRLMVAFNRRFDPHFAALRRRASDGEIGDVEMVSIISKDPAPPHAGYLERSGGIFRDMMIHDLDMARFLLNEEPVEVHAVGACLVDPMIAEANDFDTAAVILKTASGKIAQISNSRRATYGYDQRIEIHGSRGLLTADNIRETTVEFADATGYRRDPALPFFLERYAHAYRSELDAFISNILDGKALSPSGEDGLKALMLAEAATNAAKSGQPVRLR